MLSQEALQKILGMAEEVHTDPKQMALHMNVTVVPFIKNNISGEIFAAYELLIQKLKANGVKFTSYEEAFRTVPFSRRVKRLFKFLFNNLVWLIKGLLRLPQTNFFIDWRTIQSLTASKRFKKGLCILVLGELPADDLPMQKITNFKDNSIISILDFPKHIHIDSDFNAHFDTAMGFFAYHMTNIVIAVDSEKWMIYNYNASHPIFRIDSPDFDSHIVKGLIPKVVAPISPHKLSEFKISSIQFDPNDRVHAPIIKDLLDGSKLFDDTQLFPRGKKIDDLPFRKNFHKLIGKMHLDNRSGMSFGFFAKQMPTKLDNLIDLGSEDIRHLGLDEIAAKNTDKDFFYDKNNDLWAIIEIDHKKLALKVPEIWVMTIRSGADKTNIIPSKDLLKLGLKNGKMLIEVPQGLHMDSTYKPSFDTKVILAHAVGNAINAVIAKHLGQNEQFIKSIEKDGMAMSHWHGYFNKTKIPHGIFEYGKENPHVACSSPQSAIYALEGKLVNFEVHALQNKEEYLGDIHVEPHHGSNINYPTLVALAQYINADRESTSLGNKYL
jgi:hypothetical protein